MKKCKKKFFHIAVEDVIVLGMSGTQKALYKNLLM